jgi:hypothetical protein
MINVGLAVRNYGEGRISIINDKINGYKNHNGSGNYYFWRKILEWTSKKRSSEFIKILFIDNTDNEEAKTLEILQKVYNVQIDSKKIHHLKYIDLKQYNLIYCSGLPNSIEFYIKNEIKKYINNGGGIVIENINRYNQNINIISEIENIYINEFDKPLSTKSYWTLNSKRHYIYEKSINMGFVSGLSINQFSNWDILITDFEQKETDFELDQDKYITDTTAGAEFGISFSSSIYNGILEYNEDSEIFLFNGYKDKIYSAIYYESLYGIFTSEILEAKSDIIRWNNISFQVELDDFSSIYLFVASSDTKTQFSKKEWEEIPINKTKNISHLKGKYLQFMIIVKCDINFGIIPLIKNINLSYFSKDQSVRFFTKSFMLKNKPEHVILTYNAEKNDDSIINFAISGEEFPSIKSYQYIEPNKVNYLDEISKKSNRIKVMVEIVGTSEMQIKLHEFSLMFSSEDINKNIK